MGTGILFEKVNHLNHFFAFALGDAVLIKIKKNGLKGRATLKGSPKVSVLILSWRRSGVPSLPKSRACGKTTLISSPNSRVGSEKTGFRTAGETANTGSALPGLCRDKEAKNGRYDLSRHDRESGIAEQRSELSLNAEVVSLHWE